MLTIFCSRYSDDNSSFNDSVFSGPGGAPSTLGGATSVSSGSQYQTIGKGSGNNVSRPNREVGPKNAAVFDDGRNNVSFAGVANEMIKSRDRSGSDCTFGNDSAPTRQQNTPQRNVGGHSSNVNNSHSVNASNSRPVETFQHRESISSRYEDAGENYHSTDSTYDDDGSREPESYDNDTSQTSTIRSEPRRGAGTAHQTVYEHVEAHPSSSGQDPIAQAGDFNRDDADVIFLSSESGSGANRQPATRFKIHSINLHVHSPALSEMVDDVEDSQTELQLEEDAATLKLLFGLMYNRPSPSLGMNEWQVVLRLARCAQKYDVARAKEMAAAYFTEQEQLGALSPFMTYAFSIQYKLPALEEASAERSVRYDIHHLPELVFNMMGFSAFQKLAAFHTRRQSHYSDCLNSITMDPKELADQCYQTGGVCVIAPWSKLKNKLAWPRQTGRDGSKKPPEPADILRKLVTEIGQVSSIIVKTAFATRKEISRW